MYSNHQLLPHLTRFAVAAVFFGFFHPINIQSFIVKFLSSAVAFFISVMCSEFFFFFDYCVHVTGPKPVMGPNCMKAGV